MNRLRSLFGLKGRRTRLHSDGNSDLLLHNQKTSETLLDWQNPTDDGATLVFGDTRVHACTDYRKSGDIQSTPNDFVLLKPPGMVEEFIVLARKISARHIFELGIYRGGSVVAYNEILRPEKYVAIDFTPVPPAYLDQYLAREGNQRTTALYGINQADHALLENIYSKHFGQSELDIVIDDASHFLEETRQSFRTLFPHLRTGGLYVIEDWAWAHAQGAYWQENHGGGYFKGKEPVSSLLIELFTICASNPEVISDMLIKSNSVYVVKGPQAIKPNFKLDSYWLNCNKPLPKFLPA